MYAIERRLPLPTWWTGKTWSSWKFRRLETETRREIVPELFRARAASVPEYKHLAKIVRTDL